MLWYEEYETKVQAAIESIHKVNSSRDAPSSILI